MKIALLIVALSFMATAGCKTTGAKVGDAVYNSGPYEGMTSAVTAADLSEKYPAIKVDR